MNNGIIRFICMIKLFSNFFRLINIHYRYHLNNKHIKYLKDAKKFLYFLISYFSSCFHILSYVVNEKKKPRSSLHQFFAQDQHEVLE